VTDPTDEHRSYNFRRVYDYTDDKMASRDTTNVYKCVSAFICGTLSDETQTRDRRRLQSCPAAVYSIRTITITDTDPVTFAILFYWISLSVQSSVFIQMYIELYTCTWWLFVA